MRKLAIAGVVLFAVLGSAGCNEQDLGALPPSISVSPGELVFDLTVQGASNTKVATVTNAGHGVLLVDALEVQGATNAFALDVPPSGFPIRLGAGEWFAVQVTFAPTDGGAHPGEMTVFSNDVANPAVVVPLVTVPIAPEIEVTPNPMPFGVVGVNLPTTHELTITNAGTLALTVTSVTLGAGTSSAFTIAPGTLPVVLPALGSVAIPVTFHATDESTQTGSIEITSDDPDEPLVTVPLSGIGTLNPVPDIHGPSVINFGGVQRQTCATQGASITNVGSATLVVSGSQMLWGAGSQYTVAPTSFSIAPGGAQPIAVTYCPQDTNGDADQLRISSNDPDEQPFTITILGYGTPPPISQTDIHVELSWNKNSVDIDLHMVKGGGTFSANPQTGNETDCGWWNQDPEWGVAGPSDDCFLDLDDIDGYGPENINMATPASGDYTVILHYYGGHDAGGSNPGLDNGPAALTVKVWLDGGPGFTTYTKTLSLGQRWDLLKITWNNPGDSGTIAMIDTVTP